VEVNARGARLHNTVRNNVLSRNNREDVLRRPYGRLEVILSRFKTSLETSHNLWGWESRREMKAWSLQRCEEDPETLNYKSTDVSLRPGNHISILRPTIDREFNVSTGFDIGLVDRRRLVNYRRLTRYICTTTQ